MPIIESQWKTEIPLVDLASFLFKSATAPLSNELIYVQTDKPNTHKLSMYDYRHLVQRFGKGLTEAGIKEGDRVFVFAGNNLFYPVLFMGIVASDAIFSGSNPVLTARELAYQITNLDPKYIFAGTEQLELALKVTSKLKFPKSNIFLFNDDLLPLDGSVAWKGWPVTLRKYKNLGVRHWHELLARDADNWQWKNRTTEEEVNTTAAINYSSGTTGVPKGVEISHLNFVANCTQVNYLINLENRSSSRGICALPMYHAYGQTVNVIGSPSLGNMTYIMPKFDFVEFLKCVQQYKITSLALVPPIIVALCKHPIVAKFDLSHVEKVSCGAAPLSKEMCEEAQRLFKNRLKVGQAWGMTEVTCNATMIPPADMGDIPDGTVGVLAPNMKAKIINPETGEEVPVGQPGEIWINGPNRCKGYYRNPNATKESITVDGWYKTGDVGRVDERGLWYIVDRMKELIKVKANQVAPAELEALLLEHPKIADAGVIGIHFAGEERPRAYVVPKPGAQISKEEVLDHVKQHASPYKWITGGVYFINAIPKNPSGKILRKELRERAKTEVIDTGDHKAKL